jgi:hypothetical protein
VAEDHGGAKYTVRWWGYLAVQVYIDGIQCALERKIPILKSSWITESYQIWLRGDDVDLEEVRRERHGPFQRFEGSWYRAQ